MINPKCFTPEWIKGFRKQAQYAKVQEVLLEKMIYALHLLDLLKEKGLEFVFKGGTSLVLLLKNARRFSIDIDIICNTDRASLEAILDQIIQEVGFTSYTLDERRSYKPGILKAHYHFYFQSTVHAAGTASILLDVLIDQHAYPTTIDTPIETIWIEADNPHKVKTPSVESITGDKLTAFAPNTIGIPYEKGGQSFAMDICKQLFDLDQLFEHIKDIEEVSKSFYSHAFQEIRYRKETEPNFVTTPETVLDDIIRTCLLVSSTTKQRTQEERKQFEQLQRGIKSLGANYLTNGHFRIEDAILASAKIAYLAIKIRIGDFGPILHFTGQDLTAADILNPEWTFVNALKKQPGKAAFYYWFETSQLLDKIS